MLKQQLSSKIFPEPKNDGKTKLASVLVIIYGTEPKVLMIEKSKKLNIHAGEIAFPGGKWIENDNDLLDTALRETREEIGLNLSRKNILHKLSQVLMQVLFFPHFLVQEIFYLIIVLLAY